MLIWSPWWRSLSLAWRILQIHDTSADYSHNHVLEIFCNFLASKLSISCTQVRRYGFCAQPIHAFLAALATEVFRRTIKPRSGFLCGCHLAGLAVLGEITEQVKGKCVDWVRQQFRLLIDSQE